MTQESVTKKKEPAKKTKAVKTKKEPAKKTKAAKKKKKEPKSEEKTKTFTFRRKDGTLTSIPMIGKVNCIELIQANRTDWLFTRLPKELALKYSKGEVMTPFSEAVGDRCIIISKYRGYGIDPRNPHAVGECYTLLFTPHYAEKNANLEQIDEGISDSDIKKALLALDESKGLYWRNKYRVEHEMRLKERDYQEDKDMDYRSSVTRGVKKVVDDVDLGEKAVGDDINLFNMTSLGRWFEKNKLWALIGLGIILLIASVFAPGG